MKLAIIYFTYDKDYPFLLLSILSILKNVKNIDVDIYVYDDDSHNMLLSDDIKRHIYKYEKTKFNRCGNLNGYECLSNILDIYNSIAHKYDWLIKLDPDTAINQLDWLKSVDSNIYCLCGTEHCEDKIHYKHIFGHGCIHIFNKTAVTNAIKEIPKFYDYYYTSNLQSISEDYYSYMLMCKKDPSKNFFLLNKFNNPLLSRIDNGNYLDFSVGIYPKFIKNLPIRLLKQYTSISFKPMGCNESLRIDSLNRMTQYVSKL